MAIPQDANWARFNTKAHPEVESLQFRDKIAALQDKTLSRRLRRNLAVAIVLTVSALAVLLFLLFAL